MYTCLFDSSQGGETCFDPLFFHYPELEDISDSLEHTFIAGNAFKVSPVLESTSTTF
jgi:alpha-glucosidase (family GH31 glycosyl hydrolase)